MSLQQSDVLSGFIDKLQQLIAEKKLPPWQKPWRATFGESLSKPHNPVTQKPYRGMNALHLSLSGDLQGFHDPRWMGFHQARAQGWQVKPGERGTSIYLPLLPPENSDVRSEVSPSAPSNPEHTSPSRLQFKTVTVFNAEQIKGIPPLAPSLEATRTYPVGPLDVIAERLGVSVRESNQDIAYYSPLVDLIQLPPRSLFNDEWGRNSTFAHELAHASGHERRLNRPQQGTPGSIPYCVEEITAEIGSFLLCRELGLSFRGGHPDQTETQHLAYTGHWMQLLQEKPKLIAEAINQGVTAAKFLEQQWTIQQLLDQHRSEPERFSDVPGQRYELER